MVADVQGAPTSAPCDGPLPGPWLMFNLDSSEVRPMQATPSWTPRHVPYVHDTSRTCQHMPTRVASVTPYNYLPYSQVPTFARAGTYLFANQQLRVASWSVPAVHISQHQLHEQARQHGESASHLDAYTPTSSCTLPTHHTPALEFGGRYTQVVQKHDINPTFRPALTKNARTQINSKARPDQAWLSAAHHGAQRYHQIPQNTIQHGNLSRARTALI